jgi:hypothetical protein
LNTRIAAYSDYGDKVRAAGFGFIDFGVSIADYSAEQSRGHATGPFGRSQHHNLPGREASVVPETLSKNAEREVSTP